MVFNTKKDFFISIFGYENKLMQEDKVITLKKKFKLQALFLAFSLAFRIDYNFKICQAVMASWIILRTLQQNLLGLNQ